MVAKLRKIKRVKKKSNFRIIVVTLMLLFLSIIFVWGNIRIFNRRLALKEQLRTLKQNLSTLSKKQDALRNHLAQLKQNDYIEMVGREKLDFKKKGEKVVAFPIEKEELIHLSSSTENNKKINRGFFGGLLQFLSAHFSLKR